MVEFSRVCYACTWDEPSPRLFGDFTLQDPFSNRRHLINYHKVQKFILFPDLLIVDFRFTNLDTDITRQIKLTRSYCVL